jgi:hypothetical protein
MLALLRGGVLYYYVNLSGVCAGEYQHSLCFVHFKLSEEKTRLHFGSEVDTETAHRRLLANGVPHNSTELNFQIITVVVARVDGLPVIGELAWLLERLLLDECGGVRG